MKTWLPPHISKIYEALTAIADDRIKLMSDNSASVTSSSRGKSYTVAFDPQTNSITSNDNTAFYTGSVSYPMVALLMYKGIVNYNHSLLSPLSNIVWKDIMQKYKNDYDKGIEYVLSELSTKEIDIIEIRLEIDAIYKKVCALKLKKLQPRLPPPLAY